MPNANRISRQKFLERAALLSAASVIAPITSKSATIFQTNKKIRVGIIGCGSVSTQYLPHLSKSPFVTLTSTCDIIPERALNAARQYNIPNNYPSIDKMLSGAPFDLFVNLTNMQEHGRLNKLALEAGKHVWSEKPMATTYKEGQTLLDLAKQKGVRIWGAPAVVNSPQFAFMAQAINQGKLGKVAGAHAHYGHMGNDPDGACKRRPVACTMRL
jgi:predicted dehydrogenase